MIMCGMAGNSIHENSEGAHFNSPINTPKPIITADKASGTIVANSTILAIFFLSSDSNRAMQEAITYPTGKAITKVTRQYVNELSKASGIPVVE